MTPSTQAKSGSKKSWLDQVLLLITGGIGDQYDTERGQARVRVSITLAASVYMLANLIFTDAMDSGVYWIEQIYMIVYLFVSMAVLFWIKKKPGHYPLRRILTMTLDYGSLTFCMIVGGIAALPLWAITLWVTVGNGLRFGHRYLLAATCYALASLGILWISGDYWQENPYVVVTLALTAILVPAYINGLLSRLQMAHNAAIEANQAKSRFLAQASHDLRQPIHAISLYVSCLREEILSDGNREMVDNIDRSLQSVSRLFKSLLDISTLDSGGIKPQQRVVAISDLLTDIVNQNKYAAQWINASLRVLPCSASVRADDVLLTTMVQNLVSNALKYAPGADILIGCRRRNGHLSIEVHDRGPGIPAEHLPHIFEELYRVRKRGDKDIDGVGLGLAIVRRMGALMGLSVSIRSAERRGTIAIIDGLEIAIGASRQAVDRKPNLTNGLRVLLIEDDEGVLHATMRLLEKWGCIVQASTGLPAHIKACDVLLTDFDLGGDLTGADCINLVRKKLRSNIPSILITGHQEIQVRQDLSDSSVAILGKPIRPAEMRSMLTSIMLKSQNGRDQSDYIQP